MKFKEVRVQNFLSYGAEVVIPLDIKGITLITGQVIGQDSYDSNSAGKSTVLSAITYALWGETVYKQKADDVINNKVNKDCRVHLIIEDEGSIVEIIRQRKMSTGKPEDLILLVNGTDISGSAISITQQKLDKIIGIDFDIFKALMPGCGIEVASLTDSEIKLLLESILKTSELSVAYKIANERYNKLNKELTNSNTKLDYLNKALDSSIKLKEQYKLNKEEFDDIKQKEINDLSSEISIIALEIAELESIDLNSITKSIASQENHSTHLVQNLNKSRLEESKHLKSLQKTEILYTKTSSSITSKIEEATNKINKVLSLEGQECPSCFTIVQKGHGIDCSQQFKLEIELLNNKLNKLNSNNESIVTNLNNILDKIRQDIKESEHLITLHNNSIKENKDKLNKLKSQRDTLPSKVRSHKFLSEKLLQVQSKSNTFQELYEQEENNISVLQNQIQVLQKDITKSNEELLILDYWVKSFSPSGIRSYMIETVIPFLNEQAKYYCDILTSGEMSVIFSTKSSQKSGKIVEKFSIEVNQKHGSNVFKGSSKGEKARANLVISLALGALASLRTSKKLSFRMFDEVFDCIDGTGCEAVYSLLSQCLNQYETIYVITHKEDFKEIFSSNIVIRKENGFSTYN